MGYDFPAMPGTHGAPSSEPPPVPQQLLVWAPDAQIRVLREELLWGAGRHCAAVSWRPCGRPISGQLRLGVSSRHFPLLCPASLVPHICEWHRRLCSFLAGKVLVSNFSP